MSLFGELDVASAEDDPFKVPPNVYDAVLSDIKVGPTNDNSKTGMTLIFTIESGPQKGKTVREWKHLPTPADPKAPSDEDKRAMSFLKARMMDLGIPESRVNSVGRDDLIAKEVKITVKEGKGGFMNVSKVVLRQDNAAAVIAGSETKKFK
jgi:hypothetical protein